MQPTDGQWLPVAASGATYNSTGTSCRRPPPQSGRTLVYRIGWLAASRCTCSAGSSIPAPAERHCPCPVNQKKPRIGITTSSVIKPQLLVRLYRTCSASTAASASPNPAPGSDGSLEPVPFRQVPLHKALPRPGPSLRPSLQQRGNTLRRGAGLVSSQGKPGRLWGLKLA